MGKKSPKKSIGRPTKYKSEYCNEIIEYFKNPTIKMVGEKVVPELPLFGAFAVSIGVTHDTLLEWIKVHPEFSVAYSKAKQLQETHLVQNTICGLYNSPFAIFTAKNILGWRDQQDIKHSGDKENPVGMILYCPEENKPDGNK